MLSVYHVPGTVPDAKDTMVSKIVPALMELIVQDWRRGRQT